MSPAAENPDDRPDRSPRNRDLAEAEGDSTDDGDPVPDPTPESPGPDPPTPPAVREFDDIATFGDVTDVDGIRDLDTSEIDDDTLRAFTVCVGYANAALLLASLGPMVWFFRGQARLGGALIVAGILAGIRTYQTYRTWDRSRDDGGDDEPPETCRSPEP